MRFDCEITNATIVEPRGRYRGTIVISDQKVAGILEEPSGNAARTIDAEGGIFLTQGFVVRDETRGGYVTDPFEVEGALAVVAEDEGWALADVGGALVSGEGTSDTDAAGPRMEGGWWIVVPADYLEDANDPNLEFRADYGGREIVFWAFEAHANRSGGPKLSVFEHEVEFVLRGQTLYVHDDHPDVLRRDVGR